MKASFRALQPLALAFSAMAISGAASASDHIAKAIEEIRKSDNFIVVVGGNSDELTIGGDIGPYADSLSNPAVQANVTQQVNAMGGGAQAAAAGVVGAAIGSAIANAMIEADMRSQARTAARAIHDAMGEPTVGNVAIEAAKRAVVSVLQREPKHAVFRTDIKDPFDVELKYANYKRAVVLLIEPETMLSIDRNTIRVVARVSVSRMNAGKRTAIATCKIAHIGRSIDEATPQRAVAAWKADSAKLARESLAEAYEDVVRTFLSLTAPDPEDEDMADFVLLKDRVLIDGRARLHELTPQRQVFESEGCGASIYHNAERIEL